MAGPDGDQGEDRTERWDRLPELGRPPVRVRPPAPGTHEPDLPFPDDRVDDAGPDRDADRVDDAEWADDAGWAEGARGRGFWRTTALGLGELLVTAGMVLLLFVVYEVYVTDLLTAQRQDELSTELREQWAADPTPERGSLTQVEIGDAFGVLRIPRLGEDYTRVILEGTEEKQLSQGPGHYVDSALPGQPGNVGLAGHRVGKGSPFLDLDELRPGDPLVIETVDSWFVYRVLGDVATGDLDADPSGIPGQEIVLPTDVQVLNPTPNGPAGAAPTGSYLTLTTCHPRFSARQRLVIHASLDGGAIAKATTPDGPPALRER
jgi:sortase A